MFSLNDMCHTHTSILWSLSHQNLLISPNSMLKTVQYSTVQYSAVQCSTVQCSRVQCSTVKYSTVQCSAVQFSTVQCSTVHYASLHYRLDHIVSVQVTHLLITVSLWPTSRYNQRRLPTPTKLKIK